MDWHNSVTMVLQGFFHSDIASSKLCEPVRSLREESNETERMCALSLSGKCSQSGHNSARANIKSLSVHHALLDKNTIDRDVIGKTKLNVPKVNLT